MKNTFYSRAVKLKAVEKRFEGVSVTRIIKELDIKSESMSMLGVTSIETGSSTSLISLCETIDLRSWSL